MKFLIQILILVVGSCEQTCDEATRQVTRVITPIEQAEGAGARVRRIIGNQQLRNLDPFLMLDHFTVSAPAGFPDHPHRGFETVTYMFSGAVQHEDFAGNAGTIGQGDIQWMTAGRGIVHAEMPVKGEPAVGMQLWINLQSDYKMIDPQYQDLSSDQVLKVQENGVKVSIIAGSSLGQTANTRTRTPVLYLDIVMQPDTQFIQDIMIGWNGFVYVIEGFITIAGTEISSLKAGIISQNEQQLKIETQTGARVILIAGEPIGEEVVQHGPFVMNTQAEIRQAFADFQGKKNGFEGAGWKSSIGNR